MIAPATKAAAKVSKFDFQALIDGVSKTHTVRVVTIDGAPWFVAKDVCTTLGIGGTGEVYKRLPADDMTKVSRADLGHTHPGKPMVLVSESGLYKLILRSDKPAAKPFQEWVTREVLPSIRKTGGYMLPEGEPLPLPPDFASALRQHAAMSNYHFSAKWNVESGSHAGAATAPSPER